MTANNKGVDKSKALSTDWSGMSAVLDSAGGFLQTLNNVLQPHVESLIAALSKAKQEKLADAIYTFAQDLQGSLNMKELYVFEGLRTIEQKSGTARTDAWKEIVEHARRASQQTEKFITQIKSGELKRAFDEEGQFNALHKALIHRHKALITIAAINPGNQSATEGSAGPLADALGKVDKELRISASYLEGVAKRFRS